MDIKKHATNSFFHDFEISRSNPKYPKIRGFFNSNFYIVSQKLLLPRATVEGEVQLLAADLILAHDFDLKPTYKFQHNSNISFV